MSSATTFDEVFLFSSQGLPKTTFHVARFTGTEGLNELFLFRILLVCNDAEVDTDGLLHEPAQFTIRRENGEDAVFTGYPSLVEQGGCFNGYAYYTVELRPTLWKLTRIVKSAIFLDQDIMTVADSLLNSEKFLNIPHEFRFTRSNYPKPEFAMQYEETLYDYMQWRLEEQGAYFYFAPDGDTVIFADSPNSHDASADTVFYSPASGLEVGHINEVVTSFTLTQSQLPARVIVRGYDWRDPNRILAAMAPVSPRGLGDVVLTNEAVTSEEDAQRLATIRAEELLARNRTFTGTGSVPYLRPGVVFTLDRHYRKSFNRDYMVTKITHEGSQEAMLGMVLNIPMDDAPDHLSYRNTFECMASDTTFRPTRTASRAKIAGMVHAFIDGEGDGSRPFLDEYGRYKLLFPFDVSGRPAGKGTCWIRRAQEQVGKDCGMSFPLLPGTEVLVGFIDGNPDRPVITGALANGETGALTGSGNANISGIRTPGGNQITINDTDTHQGMSFLTASGNGITMSSGSVDFCKSKMDTGFDAASVGTAGVAGLFKDQLSGAFSSSSVSTMSAKKKKWLAIQAALQLGSGVVDSLSTNTTGAKSEDMAWGAAAGKTALLALKMIKGIVGKNNVDGQPFGYEVASSAGSVSESKQCNQSTSELVALLLHMFVARAISLSLGIASAATQDENTTKAAENDEKKFKKDLEIYKGITDTTDQKKEWEKHKKSQKTVATRKAIVSQVSDLLPELTAMITALKWSSGLGEKTLGGIKLTAGDQNIHMQAKTYTGVHAEQGILLNTESIGDGGTLNEWGAPQNTENAKTIADSIKDIASLRANNQVLGVEKADNPTSFIAQNTDLNYQQSNRHIIKAATTAAVVSPYISLRNNDDEFSNDDKKSSTMATLGLSGFNIYTREKHHVLAINGNNWTMAEQTPAEILLSHKNGASQALKNDSASLSFKDKNSNSFVGLSNGKAHMAVDNDTFVTVNKDKIELSASTVGISKMVFKGDKWEGTSTGILEIGGSIKVTGCTAALDLTKGVIDFGKQLHAISEEVDQKVKEQKENQKKEAKA